jgi:bile acid:Na+ symporter, BASS family
MDLSQFLNTVLPLILAAIMFGLGLSLTKEDFTRVFRFPKPVYLGLAVQIFLLPVIAYALCKIFLLPPELAIGLMLLAASPGGVTANIYSHLAGGDVALNLTLTALNSVLAAVTLPIVVSLSILAFAANNTELAMQFTKALEVFAIVLVPVGLGLIVNQRYPNFSKRADRPVRIFSILILLMLVVSAVFQNRALFKENFVQLGAVVLVFNLASLAIGYGLPRALKLPKPQSIAIAMEIGIHNSTLAMALAVSVLGNISYAMPAAFYSVVMFVTAGVLAWFLKR